MLFNLIDMLIAVHKTRASEEEENQLNRNKTINNSIENINSSVFLILLAEMNNLLILLFQEQRGALTNWNHRMI